MTDRLEAARAALHEAYVASDAVGQARPYDDGALGITAAMMELERSQRAREAAIEALEALPRIGEAVAAYNRVTGYDLCNDTRGHLERLVWLKEAHMLLDDFRTWPDLTGDDFGLE